MSKTKNGGLDQYAAEPSEQQQFGTAGVERVKQQPAKIYICSLVTTSSARNQGSIFKQRLTFSNQISALFESCYTHINDLRCIRPYLHLKAANIILPPSFTYTKGLLLTRIAAIYQILQ